MKNRIPHCGSTAFFFAEKISLKLRLFSTKSVLASSSSNQIASNVFFSLVYENLINQIYCSYSLQSKLPSQF